MGWNGNWWGDVGIANLQYRMRAIDGTLDRHVFWSSTTIDATGVDYPGPGPLTDVVVQAVQEIVT